MPEHVFLNEEERRRFVQWCDQQREDNETLIEKMASFPPLASRYRMEAMALKLVAGILQAEK